MRLLIWLLLVPLMYVSWWMARAGCRRWWRSASETDQVAVAVTVALVVSLVGGGVLWVLVK